MGSDDLCGHRCRPLQSGHGTRLDSSARHAQKRGDACDLPARDTFTAQTPLVVIGLAAIGMIFLINSHARPTPPREKVDRLFVLGMRNGDVAVRQRTELQRRRSSSKFRCSTARCARFRKLAASFNVGDIVRVNGQRADAAIGPVVTA